MKKMAMNSALLMLGTVLTLGAFAQTPKIDKTGKAGKPGVQARKEARGMGRMGKMMGDLNMTDAQKAKIKTLSEAMATKRKALMDDKSLTPEAKKEKMRELSKSFRSDIGGILTPEQKKKMAELRKERKSKADNSISKPAPGIGNTPAPKKP